MDGLHSHPSSVLGSVPYCWGPALVDPGNSKVGTESASLEKYIFNHRYREIRNGQCSRKISGEKEAE